MLAHGAGANYEHHNMQQLAYALAEQGIGTLRFNFPFMQAGKRRVDGMPVALAAIQLALLQAHADHPDSLQLLGGHSFGGRMATHWVAQNLAGGAGQGLNPRGLVLCSFPLHTAGKPSTKRIAHFPQVTLPMLFLSGTRDSLADTSLLTQVVQEQPQAELHWLETANHGYTVLKRTRPAELGDVFTELATAAQRFVVKLG